MFLKMELNQTNISLKSGFALIEMSIQFKNSFRIDILKKIGFLLIAHCLLFIESIEAQNQQTTILITNPSSADRKEEVVAISWKDIIAQYPRLDTANFKIINRITKKELPFQLEYRGEKSVQNLLVQLDLAANTTAKLLIETGKPSASITKTYGRYVPERKDDFAWENDKIAFRAYGKALELSPKEMAYGFDVWVKSTSRMVINERYKRGKYHDNLGDGMDYYHVGYTLGAGNIAPCLNDSIYYSKNYVRWKILDNGPLRTTFSLEYDEWDVAGMKVKATKTISLDAGSQLNRVEALYRYFDKPTMDVVVGIVKRKESGTMLLDEQQGIMGYWEPQMGEDGITGVGAILSTSITKMKVTNTQLLTQSTSQGNKPYVYYTGAAWNKANVITTAKEWFSYLSAFKDRLEKPLQVTIE
jgi:hypothetical protein